MKNACTYQDIIFDCESKKKKTLDIEPMHYYDKRKKEKIQKIDMILSLKSGSFQGTF